MKAQDLMEAADSSTWSFFLPQLLRAVLGEGTRVKARRAWVDLRVVHDFLRSLGFVVGNGRLPCSRCSEVVL